MHFVFRNGSGLAAAVECQRRHSAAGFLTAMHLESTRDFVADCFIATTVCRTWVIMAWRRQSSRVH